MELTASLGLDLAAVIIVLYCAVAAAKKGFLRTVIQMVAYVTILLAASFLSRAAAPIIYDQIVGPMLEQRGSGAVSPETPKSNAQLISMAPHGLLVWESPQDALDSIKDALPENIDPEAFANDLLHDLSDATLRPMAINAIQAIAFVAIFALLSLLANLLLSALGVINYLPVVGVLNAALGCVVGILQGVLLVWLLALFLQGMLYLHPEGWWVFNPTTADGTFVFRYFMNPSLLKGLVG